MTILVCSYDDKNGRSGIKAIKVQAEDNNDWYYKIFRINKKTKQDRDGLIKVLRVFNVEQIFTAEQIKKNMRKASLDATAAAVNSVARLKQLSETFNESNQLLEGFIV